jgi:SAM-dependent methyltransferase
VDERVAANLARWEEMARLHARTYTAPDGTVRDGRLLPFVAEELGDLTGQRVCHLQCHLGGDSLSLARLGATVVGVDFSPTALALARARARREGGDVAGRVSFVEATVEEAPARAGTGFDGVHTSWGVLGWLPDLDGWAAAVAALLRPGGWLHLAETHPFALSTRWPGEPYGGGVASYTDQQGDYTDATATFASPGAWEWSHGVGEVVTALVRAGLAIEWLHEHPVAAWDLNDPRVVADGEGGYRQPGSTLPLSYSLRATRAAGTA